MYPCGMAPVVWFPNYFFGATPKRGQFLTERLGSVLSPNANHSCMRETFVYTLIHLVRIWDTWNARVAVVGGSHEACWFAAVRSLRGVRTMDKHVLGGVTVSIMYDTMCNDCVAELRLCRFLCALIRAAFCTIHFERSCTDQHTIPHFVSV